MAKRQDVVPIDQVLDRVRELYETDPNLFSQGFELGGRQAEFPASRDYLGLILGRTVIYSDTRGWADTQRAANLNNPTFALGALMGVVDKLPSGGRFANIYD